MTKHFLTSTAWPTVMSVFRDYVTTESEKGRATVSFDTFRRAWLAAHYEVSAALCTITCRSAARSPLKKKVPSFCRWAQGTGWHVIRAWGRMPSASEHRFYWSLPSIARRCERTVCRTSANAMSAPTWTACLWPCQTRPSRLPRGKGNLQWYRAMKRRHLTYVAQCRERLWSRAQYACDHPDEALFVNLDGMD